MTIIAPDTECHCANERAYLQHKVIGRVQGTWATYEIHMAIMLPDTPIAIAYFVGDRLEQAGYVFENNWQPCGKPQCLDCRGCDATTRYSVHGDGCFFLGDPNQSDTDVVYNAGSFEKGLKLLLQTVEKELAARAVTLFGDATVMEGVTA